MSHYTTMIKIAEIVKRPTQPTQNFTFVHFGTQASSSACTCNLHILLEIALHDQNAIGASSTRTESVRTMSSFTSQTDASHDDFWHLHQFHWCLDYLFRKSQRGRTLHWLPPKKLGAKTYLHPYYHFYPSLM